MLSQLKQRIEARIGKPVDNGDLLMAIEMAKSDVVMNDLIFGKGVTAEQFEDVVVKCLQAMGRCAG